MKAADYKSIVCVPGSVWYKKKDWRGPAHQSFFWYDNDKDLKVGFLVTQLSYISAGKLHTYSIRCDFM